MSVAKSLYHWGCWVKEADLINPTKGDSNHTWKQALWQPRFLLQGVSRNLSAFTLHSKHKQNHFSYYVLELSLKSAFVCQHSVFEHLHFQSAFVYNLFSRGCQDNPGVHTRQAFLLPPLPLLPQRHRGPGRWTRQMAAVQHRLTTWSRAPKMH